MVFVSDSSGRFATSYIPSCIENENIKKSLNIEDDYDYRMYLQRHGDKVKKQMKNRFTEDKPICDCPRCALISTKDFFNDKKFQKKLEKFQKQFKIPVSK